MSVSWGMSRTEKLTANLTQILRETAPNLRLKILPDGYVNLVDILKLLSVFKYTIFEVEDCVEYIDDQRFELKTDEATKALLIRCKDGHLFPIKSATSASANTNGTVAQHQHLGHPVSELSLRECEGYVAEDNTSKESGLKQKGDFAKTPKPTPALSNGCNGVQSEDVKPTRQNKGEAASKQNGELAKTAMTTAALNNDCNGIQVHELSENLKATCVSKKEEATSKQNGDYGELAPIHASPLSKGINGVHKKTRPPITPMSEREAPDLFILRKSLNWVLKYGTAEYGLKDNGDGFFDLRELLQINHHRISIATIEDIISMVKRNSLFELGRLVATGNILVLDCKQFDIDPTSDHLFIRIKAADTKANGTTNGSNGMDPVIKRLLGILKYDAPKLGVIVHTWGFVNISEILKLKFKEFEGLTETGLIKHVDDYLARDEVKRDSITTRRDPENAKEVQIRATRGHTFPVKTDAGFEHQPSGNTKLSKTLSFFLRHHAPKNVRDPFGYVQIDWLLAQSNFKGNTSQEIVRLVETAEGIDRFTLLRNKQNKAVEIRANYGHTLEVYSVELERIYSSDGLPTLFYGCNFERWNQLKTTGIPRTTMRHIHLSCDEDHLKRCRFVYYSEYELLDIIVYLDLKKALEDGLKFFLTFNGVVLCRLDPDEGAYMDPKYITRAVNIATGEEMPL